MIGTTIDKTVEPVRNQALELLSSLQPLYTWYIHIICIYLYVYVYVCMTRDAPYMVWGV